MDTSNPTLLGPASVTRPSSPAKRPYRSPELKRKVVEEILAPGASVARIARAYGLNANQVFTWRRKQRQGLLPAVRQRMPRLLSVQVTEPPEEAMAAVSASSPITPWGTIQIELRQGTVRIRGRADLEALRTALEILAR
ncbi:MAG: transposase [Acidobacteriota bacterium]|nr:transposase [Acidobacteriota bacterium]